MVNFWNVTVLLFLVPSTPATVMDVCDLETTCSQQEICESPGKSLFDRELAECGSSGMSFKILLYLPLNKFKFFQ